MISPIQLTPDMDTGTLVNAINNNFRQVEAENRTKVVRDEDGNNRVILGRYPDGRYGLKVAERGKDVLEASEDELIFDSSNNLFKIVKSGTIALTMPTVNNGAQSSFVEGMATHDLGYSPLVIAFMTYSSPQSPNTIITRMFGSGVVGARSVSTTAVTIGYLSDETVEANTQDVRFRWRVANATGVPQAPINASIKYYLLTETAT